MAFETAFTMDTSSIKYGPAVTREVGYDMKELGTRRVMVVTHPNLTKSHVFLFTGHSGIHQCEVLISKEVSIRSSPGDEINMVKYLLRFFHLSVT